MSAITIGCDPEFFLWNKETKRHESAHDLIPGTKAAPYKVPGGAIQVDGTAVEFNTDPARDYREFANNIWSVLSYLRRNIPSKYRFDFKPSIYYDADYWASLPDSVKMLGCDPDFASIGYGEPGRPNPPPRDPGRLRTASGHIHVGWTSGESCDPAVSGHFRDAIVMAQTMHKYYSEVRYYVDKDRRRSSIYGVDGAFRPKPYGVEYRVPSVAWLSRTSLWKPMFEMAQTAFSDLENEREPTPNEFRRNIYSVLGNSGPDNLNRFILSAKRYPFFE